MVKIFSKNIVNGQINYATSLSIIIYHYLSLSIQFKSTKQCKTTSDCWISPLSGNTIYNASEIDIDHVVPLK